MEWLGRGGRVNWAGSMLKWGVKVDVGRKAGRDDMVEVGCV